MANFNGQLFANEIYGAIYNMIISQQVFADNIASTKSSLVDMSRVDGSLYGDSKLYYSTDALVVYDWGNDAEAANLLKLYRAEDPECQRITLDTFKQIPLTVDNYLSKRAWGTEGAFSSFNSIMLGWIRDTKRVYDATTFNTYVGTAESNVGKQQVEIKLQKGASGETNVETEARNRLNAQTIAMAMSNLMVDLEDITRDYNDYGNLRSYDSNDLIAVWNSEAVNKINKLDIPMIYNSLQIDKKGEYTLPARYFGKINTGTGTVPASNQSIRAVKTGFYKDTFVKAGDLMPDGYQYKANETYTVDSTILFKIMDKRSVPYMSAFEVGTSFFNAKSLTETHYLTWGHNTPQYLKNYPFITVRGVPAS